MVSYQVKLPDSIDSVMMYFPIPPPLITCAIYCLRIKILRKILSLFVIYGFSPVATEEECRSIVLTRVCVLFLSFKIVRVLPI